MIFSDFPEALLAYYDAYGRDLPWRKDKRPYSVWLSEIMLQQTRVETALSYYARFLSRYPRVEELAAASLDEVLKMWEGLGYYARARNMHKGARAVVARGGFPRTVAELLTIPGIGSYTAGAIAAICFGQRTPAIDANALRVLARMCALPQEASSTALKKRVTQIITPILPERAGDFNQALMDLGACVCVSGKPRCAVCPVAEICSAYRMGAQDAYPVRTPKADVPVEKRVVFLLYANGRVFLRKRPENGLLGGLWEFPGVSVESAAYSALRAVVEEWGFHPVSFSESCTARHRFTHVIWDMRCVVAHVRADDAPAGFVAMNKEQLFGCAMPSALRVMRGAALAHFEEEQT